MGFNLSSYQHTGNQTLISALEPNFQFNSFLSRLKYQKRFFEGYHKFFQSDTIFSNLHFFSKSCTFKISCFFHKSFKFSQFTSCSYQTVLILRISLKFHSRQQNLIFLKASRGNNFLIHDTNAQQVMTGVDKKNLSQLIFVDVCSHCSLCTRSKFNMFSMTPKKRENELEQQVATNTIICVIKNVRKITSSPR